MKNLLRTGCLLSVLFSAGAIAKDSTKKMPEVMVLGSDSSSEFLVENNYPGAFSYIGEKEIERKQSFDVNRLLRDVPSVNIQEEDGYGLRPNIGIRGSRNERSSDITLMEDGILIAPAPYSSPAAYYFPSMGRMSGIEVYKGSAAVKYGPRTTSGAINLITTPIPNSRRADVELTTGSFNEKTAKLNIGTSTKNFGYLVNFNHRSSDGFRKLEGKGGDLNFDVNDFMTKVRFNNDKDSDVYHALDLKFGITREDSRESYLGLTLGDFAADPYRRYMASEKDKMQTDHVQYQATHTAEFSDDLAIKTTLYYNQFDRAWYKLDKVDDDTTSGASAKSLSSIFSSGLANHLNIIRGNASGFANHELQVKNNNRSYVAQGVQSQINKKFDLGKTKHDVTLGLRIHDDYEDRFQRVDKYKVSGGGLLLTERGIDGVGSGNNRLSKTRAYSTFVEDAIRYNKLLITAGLRYEHLEIERKNYASNDPGRNGIPASIQNQEDVVAPGLAVSYELDDNSAIFASVSRGFGPPAAGGDADSEKSTNYEAGYRFSNKLSFFEAAAYATDYDNLVITASDGSGDQVNGGRVLSYGLELTAGHKIKSEIGKKSVTFPIRANYTYNHSEFKNSFDASDTIEEWGSVTAGDKLPYIAPHQFSISGGVEFDKIAFDIRGKYVDAMRTQAGKGSIAKGEKIPSHFIADTSLFYDYSKKVKLIAAIDNVFDRQYAISARPAGFIAGKPRTFRVGAKVSF